MRIGINTLFLVPGDVGGTEVYLRQILIHMVPGTPEDTFVLFTSKDNDKSLRTDLAKFPNVEFVQLAFQASVRPLRIIAEQTLLPVAVWRSKVDVLWSPGYTTPLICSCPQAVTIHDLQYMTHPGDLSFLERLTLDFLAKGACRTSKSIIAISEFSKSEIIRFKFAEDDKVHVILSGVDPAFGKDAGSSLSSLEGFPADAPFLLCVAHTYPHKRVHLLVEAFEKISEEIPHNLILVGKARRGEELLQKAIDNCKAVERIYRFESLQYSQLIALYQAADVFVLPSEYEGFGLPVGEAMMAGTAVVTSRKASLPEVGGEYAFYIEGDGSEDLADVVMNVISLDKEKKHQLLVDAKEWASSFSWKECSENTLNSIRSIASSS